MTIRLEAGECLTQWDKDQRVVMTDAPEGVKVHFASNMDREGAYVVCPYTEDGATYADIPNIVLTHAGIVNVYIYADDRTIYAWRMAVRKREKPADYVYTETELLTWEALDERIKKLEENTGSGSGILAETDPTVFVWAKSHLPFTVAQLSAMASGAGFVVNPTNFADGKTYFRYHAGATSFTWTNPNPQRGAVTITVLAWSQYGDKTAANAFSALNIVYGDGTTGRLSLVNGQTVTMTTDANKVLTEIRGNYDHENWVLLDMSVLTIAADYPAPTGTVKSVNGNLPDEEGNVQIPIPEGGTLFEPAEEDIPKVFFGGALQQTKDEAVVSFRYISKTQDISGYAEIKAQGNSSMNYPKKNQTVKMFVDEACETKMKVDFKGWGKQNKHCYKANWIDLSHARNVVSARLWGDIVKSRSNYAELPELLRTSPNQGAIDGFPVKVYAAGIYQGRYTMNIPKDKWMANMDDELDTHCILCGEGYNSGCFRQASVAQWTDEIHDAMPESIKNRWIEVINFVMNSTDEEFKGNLGNYFDVQSLIDYHLFGLASCGIDAYGKNQLYMTYDGQKWIASMYDMDSTWGLFWHGGSFVATDYPRTRYEDFLNESEEGNLLYIRLEQNFHEELQARWAELKNDALHIDNIINRFERFTDIAPAELVKEDYASTTGGGAFTGIPQQGMNNIQQLRSFALARIAWTDTYISELTGEVVDPDEPEEPDTPTSVPCIGISLSASELTFTEEGTQTLTATVQPTDTTDVVTWSSDAPGIASVENGIVTAKTNGNAVITATCGTQSATCAVTVSGIVDTAVYSMPETTFDGSNATVVNTGVMLMDETKDYTVFIDFTAVRNTEIAEGKGYKVVTCEKSTSPWPGWKVEGAHKDNGSIKFYGDVIFKWYQELWGVRNKMVIRHSNGVVSYTVDGRTEVKSVDASKLNLTNHTDTLKIGEAFNGTIHSVKVWFEAKSDAECLALVNS